MPTYPSNPRPKSNPFGSSINTRNFSAGSGFRFGFNTQEKDNEIYSNNETYTATFWEYDGRLGRRWNLDNKPVSSISTYGVFANTPIVAIDLFGDSVWLYTTTLPGDNWWSPAFTHSFLVVKTSDNVLHYYVYGPKNDLAILGGSQLIRKSWGKGLNGGYSQDKNIIKGKDKENKKQKNFIQPPKGINQVEFDNNVISVAESFGNNPGIEYNAISNDKTSGNCNTSTTTILMKAGVANQTIKKIVSEVSGVNWGFGDIKPWTKIEQEKAIDYKEQSAEIKKEQRKIDGPPTKI